MPKVAILGANGQVGAELCLMLADNKDIALVPICRNRSGSAFLRWQGIPCRHGRVAEAAEAQRLLADCDVIINCSLATGTPAAIRRVEDRIAYNMFAHSKPGATIVHFSTQSVYGDPSPTSRIRWLNPYGRAKLATERTVRNARRGFAKPTYILRLGHVCGALQEISNTIRAQLKARTVILPAHDSSSNTVYTAAIAGALQQIMSGRTEPGTYDLMNTPRWTWREVYVHEAKISGVPFSPVLRETPAHSASIRLTQPLIGIAARLVANQWLRDSFSKLFARVPDAQNARAQAWWYVRRARTEIAALNRNNAPAEHLSWVENGRHFFPDPVTTAALLESMPPIDLVRPQSRRWPDDLPDAIVVANQDE